MSTPCDFQGVKHVLGIQVLHSEALFNITLKIPMVEETTTQSLDDKKQAQRKVLKKLFQLADYCRVQVQNPDPKTKTGREITQLRVGVPSVLLEAFDRRSELRKRPVAAAANGHCGGCGIRMPGAEWHELAGKCGLTVCDYCGVILYAGAKQ